MFIYVYLCLSMFIYVYLCLSMFIYVYLCLSMFMVILQNFRSFWGDPELTSEIFKYPKPLKLLKKWGKGVT